MTTLHRMIMHKINKTQHQKIAIPEYKDSVFTNNDTLNKFTESLSNTYTKKTSKEYANFRTGENLPLFQLLLDTYLEDSNNNTFKLFTRKATALLSDNMSKKPSTGGFLVFADYTVNFRFILIALVNKKVGYTEEALDIVEIEQLNIDQLGMAGFVNVDNYKNPNTEYRPLSFMKGTKEVSDYFATFLGASLDIDTSRQMTNKLISVLKEYYEVKEYDLAKKEELNQVVFAYCDEKRQNKEPVNISAVSNLLDPDDSEKFYEFSQDPEKNFNLNTVIESVDKTQLDKLNSFSYKNKKFRLYFEKELYNDTINLDENNNLVISDLDSSFLEQLKEEFDSSNE